MFESKTKSDFVAVHSSGDTVGLIGTNEADYFIANSTVPGKLL